MLTKYVFPQHIASPSDIVKKNMFYAVTVGASPGVYTTSAEAETAKGSHVLPLSIPCKTLAAARAYMDIFAGAVAVVYTDGACKANGSKAADSAGVGVYWGHGDPRNVARLVRGTPTNNVAELEAVEDAVDTIVGDRHLASSKVVIVTDSKYSIDVLRTWYDGFVRRGWKTVGGETVANQDLIRRIHAKLLPTTVFAHIRGHRDHLGNIAADALAVAAVKTAAAAAAARTAAAAAAATEEAAEEATEEAAAAAAVKSLKSSQKVSLKRQRSRKSK
jgi:ribonuclease HI